MKNRMIIAAMFLLAASVLPAAADMILTVTATQGNLTVTYPFLVQCNAVSGDWTLPAPVALMSNGQQLGTIKELEVQSDVDPYVNLFVDVQAGATDTTFDIASSVVSFAPLLNPNAYASAGITLTSDYHGATITGLFDGGKTYQARYNGSTVYANLLNGFSIAANDSGNNDDRSPAIGTQTILDSVSSIESEFNFILSANEQASATSRFEVDAVPEPATLSLLILGGLALLRRRK
jgi:hypothetical protein